MQLTDVKFQPINSTNISSTTVYSIRILTARGDELEIKSNGTEVKGGIGEHKIATQFDNEGEYTMFFKITTPDYVSPTKEYKVEYRQKIANYSLSPQETGTLQAGPDVIVVDCEPVDGGTFDSSKTKCALEYPANTRISDLKYFTTKSVEESNREVYNLKLADTQKTLSSWKSWALSSWVILAVGGIIGYLIHFILPRIYMFWNVNWSKGDK